MIQKKELISLLKVIRRDLKAMRNRLKDSTDRTLCSSRIEMISTLLIGESK